MTTSTQPKVAAFGVCRDKVFQQLRVDGMLPSTTYALKVVDDDLAELTRYELAVAVIPIRELIMLADTVHNLACDVTDELGLEHGNPADQLFELAAFVRKCMTPDPEGGP